MNQNINETRSAGERAFTPKLIEDMIADLEQVGTMRLVAMPHTFIPTEIITRPTIVATRARVASLRSSREKYAQAAQAALLRWNETQEAEREAMWTLQKQEEDWKAKKLLSKKQK